MKHPHEGQALAADEVDHDHHRPPGVASVHTRAVVTWVAIYPLVAAGMVVLGRVAPDWPAPLRALVLTAIVVPVTVYATVPQLLRLELTLFGRFGRARATAITPHSLPAQDAGLSTEGAHT
ncbi:hypothetical protein H1W00_11675 [Aeromicrobium sp. Marseille-Q0843]|uniref:Uncharacterized protein n=1 Tax=Aeromicrobium phoceense TaxID=2754045 RepID=A0A838XK28_9ACTN|nr:hypothetical protein [Aeromicrobium phoceense]MBA4609138.1 hypothetical protein [Aeromicrobium phoceense]